MKRIEIIVNPQGQVQVETKGFAGAECSQASQFVELALGRVTTERKTAAFYQGQAVQTDQHLRQSS